MRQIRFHDLRHSCASLMLANGVPLKQIQEWLGHSDMGTTVHINYPHTSDYLKAKAACIVCKERRSGGLPDRTAPIHFPSSDNYCLMAYSK